MIIRKPYAFLIKHFKRIHIFLFLLCAYITYKTTQLYAFMKEFIDLGTYDYINEPISRYITFFSYVSLFLIIGTMIVVLVLLFKKQKPWKMYIIPIITYSVLFVTFIATSGFFQTYISGTDTTGPRAVRDILLIVLGCEYITFLILLIRILGIDLNKFNFKSDEEYLELSEADQAEMEINIDIDKDSVKRFIRRFKRTSNYYFQEHKKQFIIIVTIVLALTTWKTYEYIFITNKTYKEGDNILSSGYEIKINNSYFSNLDYKGYVISKESNFVILDVTITNKSQKRKINFARFHVMNGTYNYSPTAKTYGTQFFDLGKAYEDKTIDRDETFNTILIFKVDKKLDPKRFVLYYQEFNSNNTNHLRKIKLKLKNLTNIEDHQTLNINEPLVFKVGTKQKEVIYDEFKIADSVTYSKEDCSAIYCTFKKQNLTAKQGEKILEISFASNEYEGKDMIDFLTGYGKINYIDSNDKEHSISIKNALPTQKYYGKYVYVNVPEELSTAKSIELIITVRNQRYKYKLR